MQDDNVITICAASDSGGMEIKMKIKKMKRRIVAVVLMLTIVLASCGAVFASNPSINDSTVITQSNLTAVLSSLGINSSKFVSAPLDAKVSATTTKTTVGDLKKEIASFDNSPKTIIINADTKNSTDVTNSTSKSNCIALSRSTNVENNYTLNYTLSANYSGKSLTGVSNPTVSLSGGTGIVHHYEISKISSLKGSCTATKATLTAKFTVTSYLSVANLGWLEIGSNNVSSSVYWAASDWL